MFKIFRFEQKQYENKQSKQDKFYSTIFTLLLTKKINNFLVRIDSISGSLVFPFLSILVWLHPAEISRVSGLPYKNDGFSRRTC